MKEVLCHEWLFFCSREDLEPLQLVRRSLRKTIVARSNALPLRSIHRVNVNSWDPLDMIEIFVKEDCYPEEMVLEEAAKNYYGTSFRDGDFAQAFCRLQHTHVRLFTISIEDSPFLRYMKAQEADALNSFFVMSIHFEPPKTTDDYEVLDSIVNLLRPRTIDVSFENGPHPWDQTVSSNSKYLEALACDSFLNHLQICPLNLWRGAFPPPSFIFSEPGYPSYDLKCRRSTLDGIDARSNVADGIDAFIESFVRDGCANKKLKSVYIRWSEWPDSEPPCPTPKQLSNPTMADEPLPEAEAERLRSNDIKQWICGIRVLSECEMHSFVNVQHRKLMEVKKWSVKYFGGCDDYFERSTTHILQCLVRNF